MIGTAFVLFLGTLWLFWPALGGAFIRGMDDDEYLRQAMRLKALTWGSIRWAFTTTLSYYQPLPRLSHVFDYQLWGIHARGHHATNLVLHALNAALVFGFLWTLLGKVPLTAGERFAMSSGIAVVFAVHPLQAEPVAWMAARTHLMWTAFGLGCLWAYIVGARRWIVWTLFVAALLCNPMAVSLPLVMLAIDYYPLQRPEHAGWGGVLRGKAVMVAFGIVAGTVTMIAESQPDGMMVSLRTAPLSQRLPLMLQSLAFYSSKLFWPVPLFPYYPAQLGFSTNRWVVPVSALGVLIVSAVVAWQRRRIPAATAGWWAYVMLILPVSGLMQTGSSAVALRYAYMAMLPLLLAAAAGILWVWRRSTMVTRSGLIALVGCELCIFAVQTHNLIPIWHESETLWRTALKKFPDAPIPNRLLVDALLLQGRNNEALEHARRYEDIAPKQCDPHLMLGTVLTRLGRFPEAIEEFKQALQIEPDCAGGHLKLGDALLAVGRNREAITRYQQALQITPDSAETHCNLGTALAQTGRLQEAIGHLEQAVRLKPDYVEAHHDLGNAFLLVGRAEDAIAQYELALRIKPDCVQARDALAQARAAQ